MSEIILFTSKTCMYCPAERQYLKERDIDFVEVDVHSNAFQYLEKDLLHSGIVLRMVPAIVRRDGNKMRIIERTALF